MPPKKSKTIQPLKLDSNVNFNSVGGLEEHIKCLREMVLFPLMYPDLFKRFNTRPPKGVLFHGPPGTGKTLLARALAQESSLVRGKKVAFFMRKGADIMSKWYGESEKHLKMLFQQANKMRPSIIFFDEVDALAPARVEGQGEACASVVATLLVEMDGLWDRGDVIVIGATNRPDCLDPALRRSGRFDRELYFPPPSVLARRDILAIYTRHWMPRPTDEMLDRVAQTTSGYVGSDLKALCSEAVLRALRRMYPQVYDGDYHCISNIDTRKVEITVEDLLAAKRSLLPTGARCNTIVSRHLAPQYEPLMRAQVNAAASLLKQAFPHVNASQEEDVSPSVFLISGNCAETHLAPALLAQMEHCSFQELSMSTLHSTQVLSQERAIISIFSECRRADRRSVIFIPNVAAVWEALAYTPGQSLLLQLWRTRAAGDNVLLLATCNVEHSELPEELQELFPMYQDCVYRVRDPTATEVLEFLKHITAETSPLPATNEKTDQTTNFGMHKEKHGN
ncbi:ATPase family AAA domain-containing protein 2-like [Pectinophora gossypiella]|uniref:ATPase family AAA domain-containing protein 2-like n=1 Tax=Pectinophora gossypiella TaxID=13191 RepID=UPI00214F2267|nr:ATPase family AAA domain-containing protein 2-like [Pectinophora gossypiella]